MSVPDVFFAIGKTHKICEDYGIAGFTKPPPVNLLPPDMEARALVRAYGIVSDGCSTGQDTDFGSRLLCRAAMHNFGLHTRSALISNGLVGEQLFIPEAVIWQAERHRDSLDLPTTSLHATLGVVYENLDKNIEARLVGDGVIAARRRDGSGIEFWLVQCSLNAPTYLSYLVMREKNDEGLTPLQQFQKLGGGRRLITYNPPSGSPLIMEDSVWATLGTGNCNREKLALKWVFDRTLYDVVAVMTDGVESFQRPSGTSFARVPVIEVLMQIMDFKNLAPGFVQRRVGRFLSKFCVKHSWQHTDDLCVAAIATDLPSQDEQDMPEKLCEKETNG